MGDTITIIKTIHDTLRISNTDTLETLSKVDSFYNSAWSRLIIMGSIIGIVIPLIYALYQRQLYKQNKKELSSEINSELVELKKEVHEVINIEITKKITEFNERLDKKVSAIDGGTFHIQGSSHIQQKNYYQAFVDYVTASSLYIKGEDYLNLQVLLKSIYNQCIPQLTKEQIEELKSTEVANIDTLIETLKKNNSNGIFTEHIRLILKALNNLKKTDKEVSK